MFRTRQNPMIAVAAVTEQDRGQKRERGARLHVELLEKRIAPWGIAPTGFVAEAKLKNA